jgi:hypothetical protein
MSIPTIRARHINDYKIELIFNDNSIKIIDFEKAVNAVAGHDRL